MLGHDDVTGELEPVAIAHFPEDLHKEIPSPNRGEQRQSSVTATGDEVEMVLPVSATQSFGVCLAPNAPPLKSVKDGHPNP